MSGVFQTYYQEELLAGVSSSEISWIGSLQAFFLVFGGLVTGPLFDMGYLRQITVAGSFLVVFGMMMTSISTTYWQLILAQGVVVGLGNGCLFLPSISVLPTYFRKKMALSQGIASAGSGLGMFPFSCSQQPRTLLPNTEQPESSTPSPFDSCNPKSASAGQLE